jgi:hypothetical protein
MIRHPLSFATGMAVGALIMYYLDAQGGGRRRALVRDKLVAAGHDAADFAEVKGKRAVDHLKGYAATRRLDRTSPHAPESEQQLHDRIRSRLGRLVSHPRSVQVEVRGGEVCLRGHILTKEQDGLLREVQQFTGVEAVRSELVCHDTPEGIPELQGRTEPPGREQGQREPSKTW